MDDLRKKYSSPKAEEIIAHMWMRPCKSKSFDVTDSIFATLKLSGIDINRTHLKRIMNGREVRFANDSYKGCQKRFTEEEYTIIKNTIKAYKQKATWNPCSKDHIQEAYYLLVDRLVDSPNLPDELLNVFSQIEDMNDILSYVIVFCEIIQYKLPYDNGRLSRLWLNVMLSKIDEAFSTYSVEKKFLSDKEEFEKIILNIESGKYLDEMAAAILAAIYNTLFPSEKHNFTDFDHNLQKDMYSFSYFESKTQKKIFAKFENVFSSLSQNTILPKDELYYLYSSLSKYWDAYYTEWPTLTENLVKELEKYNSGEKIDILYLLYIVNKCHDEVKFFEIDKENFETGQFLNQSKAPQNKPKHNFARCCIEVHNRNIKTGYKGNGQGGQRKHLLEKCDYLKDKPKSAFMRACRTFENELDESQKDKMLYLDNLPDCPSKPSSTETQPYCITNPVKQ